MHKEKAASSCSKSRGAADGQTTALDRREVVSHVRTRSLDRSSPRVERSDDRATRANNKPRNVTKNLEDYLPRSNIQRKTRKKPSPEVSESALYSPKTLEALENAERLINEAQKKILEASYDVHSSPERNSSTRSPASNRTEKKESSYIRDIVATRFHEANESGRIFTRPSARRPIDRLYRPEVRRRRFRRFVEQTDGEYIQACDSSLAKNERTKDLPIEPGKKARNSSLSKSRSVAAEIPTRIFGPNEPTGEKKKCTNSREREDDRGATATFQVQEGPHVDIRNGLTTTRLGNVDISPRPSPLPVSCNAKTYEFRHESYDDEIGREELAAEESSRDGPEVGEPSRRIADASPAVSSNRRGSSPDLVENKSDRSTRPECVAGREDAKISSNDVRATSEKSDNPGKLFTDFSRRPGTDEKRLANEKVDSFDRALRQFFHKLRADDRWRRDCRPEADEADGKSPVDLAVSEKSADLSLSEYFRDADCLADDWQPDEIRLTPPRLGELENALRKIDGTLNEVSRGARNLGVLLSEYSVEDEVSVRSRSDPVTGGSRSTERERSKVSMPAKGKRSDTENQDISGFFNGISRLAQCDSQVSPVKKAPAKKIDAPKFSTPLSHGSKIGKSSGNNADYGSKEFASFFNGIHGVRATGDKSCSRNRESPGTVTIADDKAVTRQQESPGLSAPTRNDLALEKRKILDEIEEKCNFDALFNRDRSSLDANNETRDAITLATRTISDKRKSATSSLIQDSPIERDREESDRLSVGTNFIEEYFTRKDSSESERSAAPKTIALSENQIPPNENVESTIIGTSVGERSCVVEESMRKEDNSGNSISPTHSENIAGAKTTSSKKTPNNSIANDETQNPAAKEEEDARRNKHLTSSSSGSSRRDRTSFDVSTAYSEDFEAPTGSESKAGEKVNSTKDSSHELGIPVEEKTKIARSEEIDASPKSLVVHSESEKVVVHVEKSSSTSVKASRRSEDEKIDEDGNESEEPGSEGKASDGSEEQQENWKKCEERSSKDNCGSSIASTKGSRASSSAGESCKDSVKPPQNSSQDDNLIASEELNICTEDGNDPEKSKDSIETIPDDPIDANNQKLIEPNISEQNVETLKPSSLEKISETEIKSRDRENHVTKPDAQFEKKCQDNPSHFEEIANFENFSVMHSTPKHKDSKYENGASNLTPPASISNDSKAIDTCVENYSEGELYLPSSCSYSLGEIRISELGTYATSGAGTETALKNTDGVKIFFSQTVVHANSSNNTINALTSPIQSLGEVQETDVESICSSRGMSDGQCQQAKSTIFL